MNKPIIIIAGPTACGKTDTSICLAEKLNTEIISADSMQIYKTMDIGTAKPTKEEMRGITHHLIDELNPDDEYSVAQFKNMATARIKQLHEKGKIPIVVGGTGFYINAVIYNNDFTETKTDVAYRQELQQIADSKGSLYLHEMLKKIDAASADTMHPNNVKRVIRALEYYKQTGTAISEHNANEKSRTPYYDVNLIVLNMPRACLYERINQRVDGMMKQGLLHEVESLYKKYDASLVSMQGLGYKEFIPYLKGEGTLEDAVEILKRDTRHFAKRQLTWFTHQCDGTWIDRLAYESADAVSDAIIKESEEKQIGFY